MMIEETETAGMTGERKTQEEGTETADTENATGPLNASLTREGDGTTMTGKMA